MKREFANRIVFLTMAVCLGSAAFALSPVTTGTQPLDRVTTGKGGGLAPSLAPAALAAATAFRSAIANERWSDAIGMCSTSVQSAARDAGSAPGAFLSRHVPVKELADQADFPITGISSRDGEAYRYDLIVPVYSAIREDTIPWVWTLEAVDGVWRVDFPLKSVEGHLRGEERRLGEAERQHARDKAHLKSRLPSIHLTLATTTSRVAVGDSLFVSLELTNGTTGPLMFDSQQVNCNGSFTILDESGTTVPYTMGPVQTSGRQRTLAPGESVVLIESLDLTKQYDLTKAGTYTVRFNGYGLLFTPGGGDLDTLVASNPVAVTFEAP